MPRPPVRTFLLALVLLSIRFAPADAHAADDTLRVTVMTTTDLHGWVLPWDYYADREEPRYGMAQIATLVDSVRTANANTLLLDAGDWLQGNAMAEYFARVDSTSPYPLLVAADRMRYDAMVLGNHELNFGIDNLHRRIVQTETPILGANIYAHGTNTPAYLPYIIREVDGVRVAVVGLTTPGSAVWDRPRVAGRLDFGDGLEAAHRFVAEVRERGADMVVILAHTGFEGDTSYPTDGLGPEHFGRSIAEEVAGVDLLVLGHTHRVMHETIDGPGGRTVGIIQAGRWGDHLGIAELAIVPDGGGWRVASHGLRAHSVRGVQSSPEIEAVVEEAHQAVRRHMAAPLARTAGTWETATSRREPTAAIALIHRAQREETGAQLSAAAAFTTTLTIGPGDITLGQITQLYPYENALYVVEISGRDLRGFIEHSARYYESPTSPGEAPRINRSWPGFNFDMIDGVEYALDLTREPGDRVVRLEIEGRPVRDDDVFTMAVNSYRAEGGGGFPGMGDARTLEQIDRPVRDIIAEYLRRQGTIEPEDVLVRNWELYPLPAD